MEVDQSDSNRLCVPEFAQAWHPSVRRPTVLPHPGTYDESIDPDAIFELRKTPRSKYIFVIPHKCVGCHSANSSCSRLSPCTRCSDAARTCHASVREGYQELPMVKASRKRSSVSESIPKAPSLSRPKRAAATQSIINQKPLTKKLKLASASLGPPGRPIERRGDKEKVDVNPSPQKASIASNTTPAWMPVEPGKTQYSNGNSVPVQNIHILDTPPRTPRVWANSLAELTAIFPEFTKTITGISWQKFDVPTLFLGHHRPEDTWRDENTLEITREWSYSCVPEALEGDHPHDDCHAPRVECGSVQSRAPTFSLSLNPLPSTSPSTVESEALPCNDTQLLMMASRRSPRLQLPLVLLPCPTPQPNSPAIPPSSTSIIQPFRLPVQKPPEIETLVQSRACSVPLLVFASQESGLLPRPLSAEYACVCLGFFFISDIKEEKVSMSITPTYVVGRVRWRVTLEWAPGGEDGLLENVDVGTHPWWIDPTNCAVKKDAGSVTMPYRPRNLSDQYFSFLPLDLLADFKPSEFFPRGWYCRECGMLNAQRFFRHQICQSSRCKPKLERGKATSNDNALIGHVDPLQALQDVHHFVRIHDPLDVVPSSVCGTDYSWSDGMRTLAYEVNSGTNVKHVFTGNQEILQEDATRLLLAVQKDVILSRSDLQSPYFTWSTKPDSGQTYTGYTKGNPDIPRPILDVQDVLLRYMHGYGEISDSNISHILIQAWVTPGSKRGTLFKATSHAITILCLGAEVVMNLVPKRGFAKISIKSTEDPMDVDNDDGERILSASYPVDDGSECPSETVGSAAVIDVPDPEITCVQYLGDPSHNAAMDASGPSKKMQRGKGTGVKTKKPELSLTLVHGDAVILDGDDFECQIKRSGTTILLIGSSGALQRILKQQPESSQTAAFWQAPAESDSSQQPTSEKIMAKTSKSTDGQEPQWGRVLICGGTDWPKLGRKERGGKGEGNPDAPDLLEPHILRSLSNIKITSIHASCCGCHFICLDVDGAAWMFGRSSFSALGVPGEDAISENTPRRVLATDLGADEGVGFVYAACGRSHTLLVGSDGRVWSAGANNLGQCGHSVAHQIPTFRVIDGPFVDGERQRVVKAAAGITFSILLTEDGKVFSFGSGEKGQLGNGRTGEHIITGNKTAFDIEPEPIPLKGLDDKTIVDIACGPQHGVALDSQGIVYVWGYNGYCRLGLGNQQDVLIPKAVPQFTGPSESMMGAHIIAGPSNTVVLDKQQLYWMAGKWKNSGEGSSGSPYSSFRFIQDLMGCKILGGSCGGVTHFALTSDDDGGVMTVAWGQNASYGELGLGPEEPKSATKPTRNQPLAGIDVISVAAGQHTTLFLAKPNAKLSDLPRHPAEVDAPDLCIVCAKDNGDDDPALECDKCDHPYHLGCLDPPLEAIPEGEWFCPQCIDELGALSGHKSSGKKGTTSSPAGKSGTKRKAAPSAKEAAPKRKK